MNGLKFGALVMPLLLAALPAFAQAPTPGYNHTIPEQILTPDTVETRIGTLKFCRWVSH